MNDPIVYRQLYSKPWHRPPLKTRHYHGHWEGHRAELPHPIALQAARYVGENGFYLFDLNSDGNEMREDAVGQAGREFGVGEDEWMVLRPGEAS